MMKARGHFSLPAEQRTPPSLPAQQKSRRPDVVRAVLRRVGRVGHEGTGGEGRRHTAVGLRWPRRRSTVPARAGAAQ